MNITLQQRVYVRDEEYRVTLQKSLLSLGLSEIFDMLGRVMNAEKLQEVSFQQESLVFYTPCVHWAVPKDVIHGQYRFNP